MPAIDVTDQTVKYKPGLPRPRSSAKIGKKVLIGAVVKVYAMNTMAGKSAALDISGTVSVGASVDASTGGDTLADDRRDASSAAIKAELHENMKAYLNPAKPSIREATTGAYRNATLMDAPM
jgi:hypothetical protein